MALTKEQLDEVRRELAARMGGDGTYKNPRTEGAGFMGFGTKTDPLLGEARPSDNLIADNSNPSGQLSEPQDLRKTVQENYEKSSGEMDADVPLKKVGDTVVPEGYQLGTGTIGNKYAASQGYEPLDHASYNNVASTIDDAGGAEAVNPNAGRGNGGENPLGGGWASAAGGALNGAMQGHQNYLDDPNMRSGQDGYGKHHRDYRAEVGGGFLGGVLGYYGGPVGAAVAGPAVKLAHPYAERGTREVMNFGDKIGGESGSLTFDPIGTMASGKYSWGDLGKGALFGPAKKWFKF